MFEAKIQLRYTFFKHILIVKDKYTEEKWVNCS